jgi:hypothetical protein
MSVSPRDCGTKLTFVQSHTSDRHFKYPPGIRRCKRNHPPKCIEGLWHLMMTTERYVPTTPWPISVRCSRLGPPPSTRPTTHSPIYSPSGLYPPKIISHQARPITQSPSFINNPQIPNIFFSSTRSISPRQPFYSPRWNPFFSIFFISGSSRAAQNNTICSGTGREGNGMERDRTGCWDRKMAREGGRGHMYGQTGQAFWGVGKVLDSSPSFALSPGHFVGLFVFFLLLTNLKIFAFFRICVLLYSAVFLARRASSFFFFLPPTLTTILLLLRLDFSLLLFFLGCHLFVSHSVCHDYYST